VSRKETLIVFVKNPEKGKVKTRLASVAGDEAALRIYCLLLEKTRSAALGVPCSRLLCYSDYIPVADEWPDTAFRKAVQSPGDLGQRMASAFGEAFCSGAHKAVIIGSDCPDLDAALIRNAFAALDCTDFVVGPACDGGYYLLGMKYLVPEVFQGIPWSTASVADDTLRLIRSLGMNYTLLPRLSDIDEYEDWIAYVNSNPDMEKDSALT
jgi:rSAM/selenodomain-associated transferase 1